MIIKVIVPEVGEFSMIETNLIPSKKLYVDKSQRIVYAHPDYTYSFILRCGGQWPTQAAIDGACHIASMRVRSFINARAKVLLS